LQVKSKKSKVNLAELLLLALFKCSGLAKRLTFAFLPFTLPSQCQPLEPTGPWESGASPTPSSPTPKQPDKSFQLVFLEYGYSCERRRPQFQIRCLDLKDIETSKNLFHLKSEFQIEIFD
jgi:hypothetical protein